GKIYVKQKKFDKALQAGNTAYQFALAEVQIGWQEESAALLAEAYIATGDYKNANHFLSISSKLKDSLTQQTFNAQVAGLQSSFELKEKDKAILLLKKDKELQQQKLQKQNLLMIGAGAIALLVIIGIWLMMNRNKFKQRTKELELRSKIASDLHDDVGATLSSIRMYSNIVSSQVKDINPQSTILLDKISNNSKEMIENMSDIVWMIKPGNDDFSNIENRMLNFANEICVPAGIKFEFKKNISADDIKIPMELRRDTYLIFKEAVNNAVKYSDCHSINAEISLKNHQLEMHISDDGNGFDTKIASNGNGLSNMKRRAAIHGGTFEIKSSAGEGTEVVVVFAL
ncbi:MAG: ATP-binding protein, partial [Parafilimonas sp.]